MRLITTILSVLLLLPLQGFGLDRETIAWPKVGLVLSGGGNRGQAHIGVLEALEEAHIPLYCVVGSSVGAVVGGLYCSGYSPDEVDSLLSSLTWRELFRDRPDRRFMYTGRKELSDRHLVQLHFNGPRPEWAKGISTGQRVSQLFSELVWRAPIQAFGDFDRLRTRFRAVATDLQSGMKMELAQGDLAEAMRGSMSVPILFQPVEWGDRLLVDGGIVANIPVETARKLGADIVIAVDVTSPLRSRADLEEAWQVADQVIGIMQVETNLDSRQKADVLIRPDLPGILSSQEGDRDVIRSQGARAMRAAMDQLLRLRSSTAETSRATQEDPALECCDTIELTGIDDVLSQLSEDVTQSLGLLTDPYRLPRINDESQGESIDRLLASLRRAGFTLVRSLGLESNENGARAVLDPGIVDEIQVLGVEQLKPALLSREFRPRPGGIFRVDDVERSIRRIYALGMFRWVTVHLLRVDGRNVAQIKVSELSNPVLRMGARYSTADDGEGFAQLVWESLFGRSLRAELTWVQGAHQVDQRATLESDRIWATWLTTRFSIHSSKQELWIPDGTDWKTRRVERDQNVLDMRVGQQISRLGMVYLSLGVEANEERASASGKDWTAGRFGIYSIVDSRDRLGLPLKGEYHEVGLEELFEENSDGSRRLHARFDSWRNHKQRLIGHTSLFLGWSDNPRRRNQYEFGGDDWLRSLNRAALVGQQALLVHMEGRLRFRRNWELAAHWTMLGLSSDKDIRPDRDDLTQEAGMSLHYSSLAGPLCLGVARLTEHELPWNPGWKLWLELGMPF